jgi:hypothetical protein
MERHSLVGSQFRQSTASVLFFALSVCACCDGAFAAGAASPFGEGVPIAMWRSHAAASDSKSSDSRSPTSASVSAGGITIASNVLAGCALWSWKWNGKEFLNQRDFGRLIQSSITVSRGDFIPNPTEAGDRYSTPDMRSSEKHGSPCARIARVTAPSDEFPWASAATPVQSTRAVPLEWTPENFSDGGPRNAMVWKDLLIGKDITLNYNNMGPVAKYTTVIRVPRCDGACGAVNAEIPTGYMTGEFEFQCVYDTKTRECRPVSLQPNGTPVGVFPASGYGGVILATRDHQFAMGIYGVSSLLGGSITMPGGGISLYHFGARDGSEPTAANTYKWAAHGSSAFVDGDIRFNVYLVSGTLDIVESLMNDLYGAGAK